MNHFTLLKIGILAFVGLLMVPPALKLAHQAKPVPLPPSPPKPEIVSPQDQAKAERPPRVTEPTFDFLAAAKEVAAIPAPGWTPAAQSLAAAPAVRSVDVEAFIAANPATGLSKAWADHWPARSAPALDGSFRVGRLAVLSPPLTGAALELIPKNETGTDFAWRAVWILPLRGDEISRFRQRYADGALRSFDVGFGSAGSAAGQRPAIVHHGKQGLPYLAVVWAQGANVAFGGDTYEQALAVPGAPPRSSASRGETSSPQAAPPVTDPMAQWRADQAGFQERQRALEDAYKRAEQLPAGETKVRRFREIATDAEALKAQWDAWKRANPQPQ